MKNNLLFSIILILFAQSAISQFTSGGIEFGFAFIQNRIDSTGAPTNSKLTYMNISFYISNNTSTDANVEINFSGDNIYYVIDGTTYPTSVSDNTLNIMVLAGESERVEAYPVDSISYYNYEYGNMTVPDYRVLQLMNNGINQSKVFRVLSLDSLPLSVFAECSQKNSRDASMVLPIGALGNNYFVAAFTPEPLTNGTQSNGNYNYGGPCEIGLVAIENNTTVSFNLTAQASSNIDAYSNSFNAGTTYTILLGKGEAFQLQSDIGDFTGSNIYADKKISVFSGNMSTAVGTSWGSFDYLYENMLPIKYWGENYITTPILNDADDLFRIISATDNTQVYIDGAFVTTLNTGDYYEFIANTTDPHCISTDPNKLINVNQYCVSSYYYYPSRGGYDPSMMTLCHTEFLIQDITVSVLPEIALNPTSGCLSVVKEDYISVVALNNETDNIIIDDFTNSYYLANYPGLAVPWTQVSGNPQYSFCILDVSNNLTYDATSYRLHVDSVQIEGFNAYVYGFDCNDGYAYTAGINLPITVDVESKTRKENKISIFPNPTTGLITINNEETQVRQSQLIMMNVAVYDIYGKEVLKQEVRIQKYVIDLSNQPNGIYIVKVITDNQTITRKIIKQ